MMSMPAAILAVMVQVLVGLFLVATLATWECLQKQKQQRKQMRQQRRRELEGYAMYLTLRSDLKGAVSSDELRKIQEAYLDRWSL